MGAQQGESPGGVFVQGVPGRAEPLDRMTGLAGQPSGPTAGLPTVDVRMTIYTAFKGGLGTA